VFVATGVPEKVIATEVVLGGATLGFVIMPNVPLTSVMTQEAGATLYCVGNVHVSTGLAPGTPETVIRNRVL
jgi:hypothetical protein